MAATRLRMSAHCIRRTPGQNRHAGMSEEYSILNNYRKSLLENPNTIEVTDFGAGSKVFKSNTRAINQIASNAGISKKRAELLFRITNYFQPSTILEIGTSLGLATSALTLGNQKAKITTLEGCPNTLHVTQKQFEEFGFKPNNLVAVGYGSTRPLKPNHDENGQAILDNMKENRRVVIKILKSPKMMKREKIGLGVYFDDNKILDSSSPSTISGEGKIHVEVNGQKVDSTPPLPIER